MEPDYLNDKVLTDNHVKSIMKDTKASLQEWENLLKEREHTISEKKKWDIKLVEIPLIKQKEFNFTSCSITIHFLPEAPTQELQQLHAIGLTRFNETGYSQTALLEIYYRQVGRCEDHRDSNYIYYKSCYKDDIILSSQLANTIKHEFGHAIGLGHYLSDDLNVNKVWAQPNVPHPSIMAIYRPDNPDERKITQLDIDTVRNLYGENGFTEKITDIDTKNIPDWIRNNARWWSVNQISDNDFVKGLEYLIQKKVILIDSTQLEKSEQKIPSWLRKNAGWWSQGMISDEEFSSSISWLIKHGIIVTGTDHTVKN